MHVKQSSVNGTSSIGLYGFANDTFALIGDTAPESFEDHVETVLDVPTTRVTVAGTNLIGAFITGNNETILVPDILEPHEKDVFKDLPVDVAVIHTNYTCLGNNVIVNDSAAMVSPAFNEAEATHIGDALSVDATQAGLAGIEAIGTLAAFNNDADRMVISNDISDDEFEQVIDHFNVAGTPSSVNQGASQIRCGVLCNQNGFLIGKASGGPEITTIDKGLGFV
jgi:translation initiation factor 6